MDSLTFTINLKDLNDPDNEDELKSIIGDMQLLIKFLMNANPNYYLIGNMLNEQLDEQTKQVKKETVDPRTPKEKMQEYLDSIASDIIDGRVPDLNAAYCYLRSEIGEAIGPVCYAAYDLTIKLKESGQSSEWVWDFVKYYEENWNWVCNNDASPETDWTDEVNKYKEAINGCIKGQHITCFRGCN